MRRGANAMVEWNCRDRGAASVKFSEVSRSPAAGHMCGPLPSFVMNAVEGFCSCADDPDTTEWCRCSFSFELKYLGLADTVAPNSSALYL